MCILPNWWFLYTMKRMFGLISFLLTLALGAYLYATYFAGDTSTGGQADVVKIDYNAAVDAAKDVVGQE